MVVSYDAITVTVTDENGSELPWDETVPNEIRYVLPSTGGSGTDSIYTLGFMFVTAAAIMYGYSRRHREKDAKSRG